MAVREYDVPRERLHRGGARAATITWREIQRDAREGRGGPPPPSNDVPRPRTRGECETVALGTPSNPCPFVSCKYHLFLDVHESAGSITLRFPDREVWELPETCALHVADRGGAHLEQVGQVMNVTRERVRQLEQRALARLARAGLSREVLRFEPPPRGNE